MGTGPAPPASSCRPLRRGHRRGTSPRWAGEGRPACVPGQRCPLFCVLCHQHPILVLPPPVPCSQRKKSSPPCLAPPCPPVLWPRLRPSPGSLLSPQPSCPLPHPPLLIPYSLILQDNTAKPNDKSFSFGPDFSSPPAIFHLLDGRISQEGHLWSVTPCSSVIGMPPGTTTPSLLLRLVNT